MVKAINLKIYLLVYGQKLIFNLGISKAYAILYVTLFYVPLSRLASSI